jgi:hypothetical protein
MSALLVEDLMTMGCRCPNMEMDEAFLNFAKYADSF